jgi:hypothetical protein
MSTTFDPLADNDLITAYVDRLIKMELDHVGVFAQFSQNTSLGAQTGTGPADFQYTRVEKTDRGFTIYKTRPGTLTKYGQDNFSATTAEVEIYTGGVELPYELQKVQKWEFQENILDDMVQKAALYYEQALGAYLVDNVGVTSETVSGSLTFPADLILGRSTVLSNLKRAADTIIIASDLHDQLVQLPQFIEADKAGPAHTLLNGQVGRVFGMDVVVTPYLNINGIETGKPSANTIIFLNRNRPTLKTMYWDPIFKFDSWEVKNRHVFTHELRGYFDIYIWDSNALTQMQI